MYVRIKHTISTLTSPVRTTEDDVRGIRYSPVAWLEINIISIAASRFFWTLTAALIFRVDQAIRTINASDTSTTRVHFSIVASSEVPYRRSHKVIIRVSINATKVFDWWLRCELDYNTTVWITVG